MLGSKSSFHGGQSPPRQLNARICRQSLAGQFNIDQLLPGNFCFEMPYQGMVCRRVGVGAIHLCCNARAGASKILCAMLKNSNA